METQAERYSPDQSGAVKTSLLKDHSCKGQKNPLPPVTQFFCHNSGVCMGILSKPNCSGQSVTLPFLTLVCCVLFWHLSVVSFSDTCLLCPFLTLVCCVLFWHLSVVFFSDTCLLCPFLTLVHCILDWHFHVLYPPYSPLILTHHALLWY